MNHSEYIQAKNNLTTHTEYMKEVSDDNALIRMAINDEVDRLAKERFKRYSFNRVNMYRNWLSSYAVKLHP